MSVLGTTYTQVIFPLYPVADGGGHISIRMSRCDPSFPGAGQYAPPDANILVLSDVGPALLSDLELDQSDQLSTGFAALDAVSLQFRDVTSYAGTDGAGNPVSESLWPYTFFTEFFNDTVGATTKLYPVSLWITKFAGDGTEIEKCYLFHVDPNYKPQSDQLISNPMTATEALNDGAVRTLQAIEIGNLFSQTPWQSVLNIIGAAQIRNAGAGPCYQGAGYMGFALSNGPTGIPFGGDGFLFGVWASDPSNAKTWCMQATPFVVSQQGGRNIYFNTCAPSSRGTGVFRPFWPADFPSYLNFDPTKPDWFGPAGTWWISLGEIYDAVCQSFGQISDTDAIFTSGSNIIESPIAKFTPSLNGRNFFCTSPDGPLIDQTITYIDSTHISIPHTFTASGSGFFWWIDGDANQQLDFDIDAQLGTGSPLDLSGMQAFKQTPDNTHLCYPVDTAAKILPKDIYISVNAFLGAHPSDGRQWINPVTFDPTSMISDVLPLINNFLLAKGGIALNQTTGKGELALSPIGESSLTWPEDWIAVGQFQEVEPSTGATAVVVSNSGSQRALVCPLQYTANPAQYVVGPRLRYWAGTQNATDDREALLFQTPFNGGPVIYDPQIPPTDEQALNCFQVFIDNGSGGVKAINEDCWKGLCYAMFRDTSNTNIMYPTPWTPFPNGANDGGWSGDFDLGKTDAFYALGVQYGPGFSADAQETDIDRFDSISYQSVVLATFNVQSGATLLQRDYLSTSDADGKISTINVGIKKQWFYDGALRYFRLVELPRYLLGDVSMGCKWQLSGVSAYPDITDKLFGPAPNQGGTGGGTGSGSSSTNGTTTIINNNNGASPFLPQQIITGSGIVTLPSLNITALVQTGITGVRKPTLLLPGQYLAIKNNSGADWDLSTSDFALLDKQSIIVQYDGTSTVYDSTLPAGFCRMGFSG